MRLFCALFAMAAVAIIAGCGAPGSTTVRSSPTPTPSDVADAERSALGLFLVDPTAIGHWVACSNSDNWAACPLSGQVKARLAALTSSGFFGAVDGCAEEYISGTVSGLSTPPRVLSAVAESDGSVTVVIRREPPTPNLTAVMSLEGDAWLASDLASGTGPSASIFSTRPNC
jgi:hypothetical protein